MNRDAFVAEGYAFMAARVVAGGDWSIASACPLRDGWQREAWLDGAWRRLGELRRARSK